VTVIPNICIGDIFSPRKIRAIIPLKGGTLAYISIESLEPIQTNASNRSKSPATIPTNPESASHNQVEIEASVGNGCPLVIIVNIVKKVRPTNNLKRLRFRDPIFFALLSNAVEVIAQQIAVASAAISPR
jgi:hypothetical protein